LIDGLARRLEHELERSRRLYESRGLPFRVLWIVASVVLILLGFAMTILPGPAMVVIPAGLVMLGAASKTVRGWLRRAASRLRTEVSARRERKRDSRRSAGLPGRRI
jgi:4-hydroxybenzoate polyprenyltransferase